MATRLGLAYNMNTKEVIENLGTRVEFPNLGTIGENNDVRSDFVDIWTTRDSETIRRIDYGDSYELEYGSNEPRYLDQEFDASGVLIDSGVLYDFYPATGISFAPEDTKNYLKLYVEGVVDPETSGLITDFDEVKLFDTANIRIESWLPDLSAIDISDNSTIKGFIQHPKMEIPVKVTLVSGVCNAFNTFGTAGQYIMPEPGVRIPNYRIYEPLDVYVYMEW